MYSFELPSGAELELREMTGAEEELLTNQRLIRSGEAINQVLRNCFVRLGEKTDPDLSEDGVLIFEYSWGKQASLNLLTTYVIFFQQLVQIFQRHQIDLICLRGCYNFSRIFSGVDRHNKL